VRQAGQLVRAGPPERLVGEEAAVARHRRPHLAFDDLGEHRPPRLVDRRALARSQQQRVLGRGAGQVLVELGDDRPDPARGRRAPGLQAGAQPQDRLVQEPGQPAAALAVVVELAALAPGQLRDHGQHRDLRADHRRVDGELRPARQEVLALPRQLRGEHPVGQPVLALQGGGVDRRQPPLQPTQLGEPGGLRRGRQVRDLGVEPGHAHQRRLERVAGHEQAQVVLGELVQLLVHGRLHDQRSRPAAARRPSS
jgi:hypothetical protein